MLALTGTTVTVDAKGCQKDLARHIRSQQADHVLTVKDHQRTLRAALEETCAEARRGPCEACPDTAHRTANGGHGRIAIRRGWALGDPAHLPYVVRRDRGPTGAASCGWRRNDGWETRSAPKPATSLPAIPPRPAACWRPRGRTG